MSQLLGYTAENKAKLYLLDQGLSFLASNYRSRWGEIDLIMQDKEHIVFVEVRARVSWAYGGAIGSITAAKVRKIIKTAQYFLCKKNLMNHYAARFDVICIQGKDSKIEWIKAAFDASNF